MIASIISDIKYCDSIDDGYLCWPPTPSGNIAYQQCPNSRFSDMNNIAFRTCGENGVWLDRKANESSPAGWTNFTPCFPQNVNSLLTKVYNREEDAEEKFDIAERTRLLEIVGFTLSLISLISSLILFSRFKSLLNNRTRIHQHLFSAMTVQVIVRLVLYADQAFARGRIANGVPVDEVVSIENISYLCIASYVMLEYAGSVMFMWMFIEGLYLHNVVTGNSLRESRSLKFYYWLGWGLPVVITGLWAVMTYFHYGNQNPNCWYGYNFTPLYWIVQGPRLAVTLINFMFLTNIMRVIILKLRSTESNELTKIRKAVRAALVLLPLLGITNVSHMIEPPLESNVWWFRTWSYSTHFLRSFQGFFIAVIYCFLNGEVRTVVSKYIEDKRAMRNAGARRNEPSQSVPHRSWLKCFEDSEDVDIELVKTAQAQNDNPNEITVTVTDVDENVPTLEAEDPLPSQPTPAEAGASCTHTENFCLELDDAHDAVAYIEAQDNNQAWEANDYNQAINGARDFHRALVNAWNTQLARNQAQNLQLVRNEIVDRRPAHDKANQQVVPDVTLNSGPACDDAILNHRLLRTNARYYRRAHYETQDGRPARHTNEHRDNRAAYRAGHQQEGNCDQCLANKNRRPRSPNDGKSFQ